MNNRIKEILKRNSITQKELASRLGVSEPLVSSAINGNPTLKTLREIASALDVSVSSLIEDSVVNDVINCPHCGNKIKVVKE